MKPPPALLLIKQASRRHNAASRRVAAAGVLIVVLWAAHPVPSLGQHIYLDADGDGVHSASDLLNPAGTTTFDVWLRTDTNADGSAAVCADGSLTLSSYELILHASGGTVVWGSVTNRVTDFGASSGSASDAADLHFGFFGSGHPAGTYRLATVEVSVQSGAPSIRFAVTTPLSTGYLTDFGSACAGYDGDYTLKLGSDWADAEGLPYPIANASPVLSPPQDVTLREGEVVEQELHATDGDGQSLAFSKGSGPSYFSVLTTDPGAGAAVGKLRLTPGFQSAGSAAGVVLVDDGIVAESKRVAITVEDVTRPALLPLSDMTLQAYTAAKQTISALNPDGVQLEFTKSAGPDFLSVRTTGLSTAEVALEPGSEENGSATGEITVSDGASHDTQSFAITVTPLPPCDVGPCVASRLFPVSGDPRGLAIGDMNADGIPDVLVSSFLGGFIAEFLGRGNGTFREPIKVAVGDGAGWPYIADLNGDGHRDVVVTTLEAFPNIQYRLTVLLGSADGTLQPFSFYRLRSLTDRPLWPDPLRIGDVNGDGIRDLVMLVSAVRPIALLLGYGDGTFYLGGEVELGFEGRGLALGDLNRDGILDIVVGKSDTTVFPTAHTAVVRLGLGGGLFGPAAEYPVDVVVGALDLADLNRDGILDLVAANTRLDGGVSVALGAGDGSFGASQRFDSRSGPLFTVMDGNGDGKLDLAIFGPGAPPVVSLLLGMGDGSFGEVHEIAAEGIVSDIMAADLNQDGREDLVLSRFPPQGGMMVMLNRGFKTPAALPARAFLTGAERTIPLVEPAGPSICVLVQPEGGDYRNEDVEPSTFVMRADGLGSVDSIPSIPTKRSVLADRDGDGIAEFAACFARSDLRELLSGVQGRAAVEVAVEGGLRGGARIRAPLTLTVVNAGRPSSSAVVSPNPLNPAGILLFETQSRGPARVDVFDLGGRLVRTLMNSGPIPAGSHQVRIDGRDAAGRSLATGVYFYRVRSADGVTTGRFTILK